MTEHDRIAIAYHEAGHAVITWHVGLSPTAATIEPGEGNLGRVEREEIDTPFEGAPPPAPIMKKMILSALAGPLAEGRFTGNDPYRTYAGFDGEAAVKGSDVDYISDLLLRVSSMEDCESGAAWDAFEREAQELVDRFWQDIERVAEKLLEATTLTGKELGDVLSLR